MLTIGVELNETRNVEIYTHYDYTNKIKSIPDVYPSGYIIDVDYYVKKLR